MQACSQNKGEGNKKKPLQKSLEVNFNFNHNLNNANVTPQILLPNIQFHYLHNLRGQTTQFINQLN